MATYRQLIAHDGTGWHLMSPSNVWEALRIAWLLWRHPDRVAALVGVSQEYTLANWKPHPACDEACFHVCSEGNTKPPQCAAP